MKEKNFKIGFKLTDDYMDIENIDSIFGLNKKKMGKGKYMSEKSKAINIVKQNLGIYREYKSKGKYKKKLLKTTYDYREKYVYKEQKEAGGTYYVLPMS